MHISKNQLQILLENLLKVKEQLAAGAIRNDGICGWVDSLVLNSRKDAGNHYTVLVFFFKKWPEHSGLNNYPVPAVQGFECPYECFYNPATPCENNEWANWLWNSPYGEKRRQLLDFLIDEITKTLQNADFDNDGALSYEI